MLAVAALTGSLFRYRGASWPAPLQAFESPAGNSHSNYCVYVGGLTDGLLACSYVEALAAELDKRGWALVQPVLSSSYAGYGTSSLERDATELSELLAHIERTRPSVEAFAIVGHSTGCQDAVTLLATAPPAIRRRIRAVALQAPVSDREAATLEGDAPVREALLATAQARVASGEGASLLPELHYGFVPMSAARYASLVGRGGPDDMFSSDFTDAQLVAILGHMGTEGQRRGRPAALAGESALIGLCDGSVGVRAIEPVPDHPGLHTLFALSECDEHVPHSLDVPALSRRFVAAAGGAANGASTYLVPGANHNLATPETAAADFVAAVGTLLDEATRGRCMSPAVAGAAERPE